MAQDKSVAQDPSNTSAAAPERGLIVARGNDTGSASSSLGGVGGTTKIADSVVARIAGIAAREVPGVHDLSASGLGSAFGNIAGLVTGQDQSDKGVAVQVGEVECIVNLNLIVDYAASIPQVALALRRNIAGRMKGMTGLEVKEVNISVSDLYFPEQAAPKDPQPVVR